MKAPLHYIIVDDDLTNNIICKYLFEKTHEQVSVKLFTQPLKGLSFIEYEYSRSNALKPTVLLLDINMPGMTGWEFLDIFNKLPETLTSQFHIYILSSSKEDFSREIDRYPNVHGFLSKPFTQDLVELVKREFSQRVEGNKVA